MKHTPLPITVANARRLPMTEGRNSAEVFRDGDLVEVRIAPRSTLGPQVPHDRDELYFVASGSGHYRVGDNVTAIGAGDLLFAAAHAPHGFEDFSDDFAVWVVFYGPRK